MSDLDEQLARMVALSAMVADKCEETLEVMKRAVSHSIPQEDKPAGV